jgi:hypothetical protein
LREKLKVGRKPAILTGNPKPFQEIPKSGRNSQKLTGNPKSWKESPKALRKSEKLTGNQKSWKEFAIPDKKWRLAPTLGAKHATLPQNNPTMVRC